MVRSTGPDDGAQQTRQRSTDEDSPKSPVDRDQVEADDALGHDPVDADDALGRGDELDGADDLDTANRADLGTPGAPMNRRSPFYLGLFGGLGVLVAIGLLSILQQLGPVLTLVVVSLFLALCLEPIVQALRRRVPARGAAVAIVLVLVVALFLGVIALVVPPVVSQASQLATQAPSIAGDLLANPTVRRLDGQYHVISKLQTELQKRLTDQSLWTTVFGGILGAGRAVVSGLFSAFTVLVLTLYLTASLPRVKEAVYRMVPRSRRERVTLLSEEITARVGAYFLGQITVAAINGVLTFVVLTIVGVPYQAVLAVVVGLSALIPLVGSTLGAIVVVAVSLFTSTQSAIIMAVWHLTYQQVENYVIVPRVMARTVSVPGAITVIAALAGGTLLGVLGALVAIPVAAGLLLLYQEVLLPRQQQH
jgi:predicted PurR-regulated permease PerM